MSPSKKNFAAGRIRELLLTAACPTLFALPTQIGRTVIMFCRASDAIPVAFHRIPLQIYQRFADDSRCTCDVLGRVRRRNKSSLKLRRREINAALQTSVEKLGEHFQVTSLRTRQINDRTRAKEDTKHRAEPVKRDVDICIVDRVARELCELRT